MSYFPEWLRSALRMKMMLSQSVLRMLTWEGSMGFPSFVQMTFGLGLPYKYHTVYLVCCFMLEWATHHEQSREIYHEWHHKVDCLSNPASVCLLQVPGDTDLGRFCRARWTRRGQYQRLIQPCHPKYPNSEPSWQWNS